MTKPATWIELNFDAVSSEIRLSARGSRHEQLDPRSLGVSRDKLAQFSAAVEKAASYGKPLDPATRADAHALRQAILDENVNALFAKLETAAAGPLLIRLLAPKDAPDLKNVPWEALSPADDPLAAWGTSRSLLPVRRVASSGAWEPRQINGAVKVLAIAPTGDAGLANLKQALDERIHTGEIDWLDPILVDTAQVKHLTQALQSRPAPHILHFLGHGRTHQGLPSLRFANLDDEETWLPVKLLVDQLPASYFKTLRLVLLEACDGAKSASFASAAEVFAQAGADAVVAHLWPVRANVAQTCSKEFYRALTANGVQGDVALAINAARRSVLSVHDQSAEAFSPVLYLRGPDGKIFDFDERKVKPPDAPVSMKAPTTVPPAFDRVLRTQFSLVLGDRWHDVHGALDDFRKKLYHDLARSPNPPPQGLPMGTLTQWFALHHGGDSLEQEFQDAFEDLEEPAVVRAIARLLCPGVHTTLLRNPWLEHAVAEAQPERTIYVLQPSDNGALVAKREAGANKWERIRTAPDKFDDTRDMLILRPYRGYTSNKKFAPPLLTEDDYFLRLRDVWSGNALPSTLAEIIGGTLSRRPAFVVGLSMLTANHRMCLHTVYSRGLPRGSVAVVDPADHEVDLWKKGSGLPRKDDNIDVVEASSKQLDALLRLMAKEGAS